MCDDFRQTNDDRFENWFVVPKQIVFFSLPSILFTHHWEKPIDLQIKDRPTDNFFCSLLQIELHNLQFGFSRHLIERSLVNLRLYSQWQKTIPFRSKSLDKFSLLFVDLFSHPHTSYHKLWKSFISSSFATVHWTCSSLFQSFASLRTTNSFQIITVDAEKKQISSKRNMILFFSRHNDRAKQRENLMNLSNLSTPSSCSRAKKANRTNKTLLNKSKTNVAKTIQLNCLRFEQGNVDLLGFSKWISISLLLKRTEWLSICSLDNFFFKDL